jgi:hypothetical protein
MVPYKANNLGDIWVEYHMGNISGYRVRIEKLDMEIYRRIMAHYEEQDTQSEHWM